MVNDKNESENDSPTINQSKSENDKQESQVNCCSNTYHSSGKIILIIIILFVFLGLALLATKLIFRGHDIKNRNFGNVRNEMMMGRGFKNRGGYRMANRGINGKISAIDGNNITINYNNKDLVIVTADNTAIYKSNNISSKTDIKVGDTIRVIGAPNSNGQVNAQTIVDES